MMNPMKKLERKNDIIEVYCTTYGKQYLFWCPGCRCLHSVDERDDNMRPSWTFSGTLEAPTFIPSVRYGNPTRCHFYVCNGELVYMQDCQHRYMGKTVPMESIE